MGVNPSTALVTDPSATLIVGSSTALVVDANATKPLPLSTALVTDLSATLIVESSTTLVVDANVTKPLPPSTALVTDLSATLIMESSTALVVDANATKPLPPSMALVTGPSATLIVESSTTLVVDANATKPPPPSTLPQPPLIQDSSGRATEPTVPQFFAKNMHQPSDINKLPKADERLESVSQLVYCLDLLRYLQSPEDMLDQSQRDWLEAVGNDTDEQERLRALAANLLREFIHEKLKVTKAVAEVVCLVPVLEREDFQQLLQKLFHGIEQSQLLSFSMAEGLAQLVQRATRGHLNADDLVKILDLVSTRLRGTHSQSPDYINQLTLTVSRVLDSMADSKVEGLDREKLHGPLGDYLKELQGSSDPHLVFRAAYASQALLFVPDNETPWQAARRRTGKVAKGVSGLVCAVKGLDLNKFVQGLGHIQEGLAGASKVITLAKCAYEDVTTLASSEQEFLDCLKQGFSFSFRRAWYPALRGADVFLQRGELIEFEKLAYHAPCRLDPAFQWGICQRLGELSVNLECDDDSRKSAIALLGEMYRNDAVWGRHSNIKQLILDILMQLAAPSGGSMQAAGTLLQELEKDGDDKKQKVYRSCRDGGPGLHTLKVASLPPLSPSLLDRVQSKVDVEGSLRQLKKRKLDSRVEGVYIPPQAKANQKGRDDARFDLMPKVTEFLASQQKVFLLLGDSGAGKSTFNQKLERDLWHSYKKKDGRIPLLITLAAIHNPEHDMVAKQLRSEGLTEPQIRELKGCREFILICDGYDEGHQTCNLYTSNRLNLRGEWCAQMVISCGREYLGADYRDRFQPMDHNHKADSALFQEAIIAPFSRD
ncbi:hypothetical protein BGZ58_001087 [Dissophora ornata]|nr:hypothetical protein BGZ58_001087 [Dissophora ornata]